MNTILEQITEWLKGMLIDGIMNNLSGMFDAVNQQVDGSPDAEACAKGYNQCLQYCDRAVEKCHIRVLLLVTGRFSTGLIWFENKNALYLHVHLQKRT